MLITGKGNGYKTHYPTPLNPHLFHPPLPQDSTCLLEGGRERLHD